MRRSMLFLPGNNPGMLQVGGVFDADAVILDLEDAVAPTEKDAARIMVIQALKAIDYRASEKFVRVNPLSAGGAADIKAVTPACPDGLILPKTETASELLEQIDLIASAENNGQPPVKALPLIETPLGLSNIFEIARAHKRVIGLALGAEDYTAAIGAARTAAGGEILTARSLLVNAAAAAGVDSIDTPFTDALDEQGLLADTLTAKNMGFKGKLLINPRQVDVVHKAFAPTDNEIDWAERVVWAIEEAQKLGSGVIAVDGKMVDAPVVLRARRILDLARLYSSGKEAVL